MIQSSYKRIMDKLDEEYRKCNYAEALELLDHEKARLCNKNCEKKGMRRAFFRSTSNSEGIRRFLLLSALFLLPFSFFSRHCTLKRFIWIDSYLKLAANAFSWHAQKTAFKKGLNGKTTALGGYSGRWF